jgi:hypothetical protein
MMFDAKVINWFALLTCAEPDTTLIKAVFDTESVEHYLSA